MPQELCELCNEQPVAEATWNGDAYCSECDNKMWLDCQAKLLEQRKCPMLGNKLVTFHEMTDLLLKDGRMFPGNSLEKYWDTLEAQEQAPTEPSPKKAKKARTDVLPAPSVVFLG